MLAIVGGKTGTDWETISEGLSITANAETGIIDISFGKVQIDQPAGKDTPYRKYCFHIIISGG